MMNSQKLKAATLCGVVLLATLSSLRAQSFSDNFENGLSQWTGKGGGGTSAITEPDPLNSGHGMVLTFTGITAGGDLFSANPLSFGGPFQVSFDYLGLPGRGGVPGDLGGFVGFSDSTFPVNQYVDHFWFAGTVDNYPGLITTLADDGAWHHYSIQVPSGPLSTFYFMLEDYDGSGGVAGDALFDNILVTPVPEPSVSALAWFGFALVALRSRMRRSKRCRPGINGGQR